MQMWVYHKRITGKLDVYSVDQGTTLEAVQDATRNWIGRVFILIKGGKT